MNRNTTGPHESLKGCPWQTGQTQADSSSGDPDIPRSEKVLDAGSCGRLCRAGGGGCKSPVDVVLSCRRDTMHLFFLAKNRGMCISFVESPTCRSRIVPVSWRAPLRTYGATPDSAPQKHAAREAVRARSPYGPIDSTERVTLLRAIQPNGCAVVAVFSKWKFRFAPGVVALGFDV